jgi:homoserine dehydrogenase
MAKNNEAKKTWRVGIAGLGTVGGGLFKFLAERPNFAPVGEAAVVSAVCARSRGRDRGFDISGVAWFGDPVELAESPEVDIYVELVGGSEGPAKASVEAALRLGKPVVTANKALIAVHGAELAALAEAHDAPLLFEAAVMGGTPAVKMLREAMVGDEVDAVSGILNGTCNYILTEMETKGRSFADVLAEAQRLGYAEADPAEDVNGKDAAAKMAILARLAFDVPVHLDQVRYEGIEHITAADMAYAREFDLGLKLVGTAERVEGGISVRVHPLFLAPGHPLASIGGPFNAVTLEGDEITEITLSGPGAGGPQTASAVLGDVVSAMIPPASSPNATREMALIDDIESAFYMHLAVADEPGVLADVARLLSDHGVSVRSVLQRGLGTDAALAMVTHRVLESRFFAAVEAISALGSIRKAPRMIRVLDEEFT